MTTQTDCKHIYGIIDFLEGDSLTITQDHFNAFDKKEWSHEFSFCPLCSKKLGEENG